MPGRTPGGITDRSSEYDRRIDEWRKIRDCLEGEDRIKDLRNLYLPKPKAQDQEQYDRYVDRSSFYAVLDRTVRGLVGLVFRIQPMVEIPDQLEGIEDFATPEGNPLDTLLRDTLREVLSLGRYGLLVDMPTEQVLPGESIPFIAPYEAEAIWRWDEVLDPIAGKRKLVRVILEETPATNQGTQVTWLRELFLEAPEVDEETGEILGTPIYRQQLWRDEEAESRARRQVPIAERDEISETEGFEKVGEPITPIMNGKPLDHIPFWFVNTYNLLPRPEKSPMLDLANINLAHWRDSADYQQLLHKTASPTPWAAYNSEDGEKPIDIGANSFWILPEGAEVGMLEVTGQGAQAFERSMDRKEEQMAALGASLIRNQERQNVTAETTRIQKGGDVSVLMSAVQNVEKAVNMAMKFAAAWAGASETDVEDVRTELNTDFFDVHLEPQEIDSLVKGWTTGAYSKQTLHEQLQKGEIIPVDRTLEEEQELMERESADFGPPDTTPGITPEMEEAEAEAERQEFMEANGGMTPEQVSGLATANGPESEGEPGQAMQTGPGGSDGHRHKVVDGVAIAETPNGRALDHQHDPATATAASEASGQHQHPAE